jgi:hypothetical protein
LQGNFGIFDQKLAIQWVYDNIDAFGGDNQRVCCLNRYLSFLMFNCFDRLQYLAMTVALNQELFIN